MSRVAIGKPPAQLTQGSDSDSRTNLISRKTFSTLWRAWWIRDDDKLTAHESASTLFRFFRSKHVVDLKLIAALAIFLFLIHFLSVAIFSLALPIVHFSAWTSSHSAADVVGHTIDVLTTRIFKSLVTYVGPAIPIYGAVVAWAYLSAGKRLGIVDLFACEIGTLCRVGTIFDIGRHYVETYHSKTSIREKHAATKYITAKHITDEKSSQSFVSQEEYFPIFDNNSADLQSLEALVVGYITEYYTYMKAARDLQRKLASIDPAHIAKLGERQDSSKTDLWHETLANLIYVLFLGYESARKSIADLIEFQPTCAENIIVILLTELVCYSFLCEYLKSDDIRFKRLQLREEDYNEIIPALIKKMETSHQGNEKYWAPAERILPELLSRYNVAMETLQRCAKR